MAGPAVEQRLAAILAADVAGYSRLMQDDEHATFTDLNACRAVFRERIAAAGGRVVDTAGGSVLAVFGPATWAVPAALAIQFDIAIRLDPYFPNVLLQRMALKVETDLTPFVLASCHGRLGDSQAAARAWRQVFEANADFSVAQRRRSASCSDIRHFDDIVEGLRLAGIDPDAAPV